MIATAPWISDWITGTQAARRGRWSSSLGGVTPIGRSPFRLTRNCSATRRSRSAHVALIETCPLSGTLPNPQMKMKDLSSSQQRVAPKGYCPYSNLKLANFESYFDNASVPFGSVNGPDDKPFAGDVRRQLHRHGSGTVSAFCPGMRPVSRQEIAANIGPQLRITEQELDSLRAELGLDRHRRSSGAS